MPRPLIAQPATIASTTPAARCTFAVLAAQERRAIMLLRQICNAQTQRDIDGINVTDELLLTLKRVAKEVRKNEVCVFAPRSAFASEDEVAILSWLSSLQRPSQSGQWHMANAFQQALKAWAELLLLEERKLPARSMKAHATLERSGCFQITLRRDLRPAKAKMPSAKTQNGEVSAFLDRHRFATTLQFRAIGVSSQTLSRLCQRGYIERVSLGVYKKPEHLGARLAS